MAPGRLGAGAGAGAGPGSGAGARGGGAGAPEMLVCRNKACRRDGGAAVWAAVRDLGGAHGVAAKETGCLGRCGAGPNLAVLPQGLVVRGVSGSGEHVARLLERQCGATGAQRSLGPWRALQEGRRLIQRGAIEAAGARFTEGITLSAALGAEPGGCPEAALFWRQRLLSNRSAARLSAGDPTAALEDAQEVVALAPDWPSGFLRLGDALAHLGHCLAANEAYASAECLNPKLLRDTWHIQQRHTLAIKEDCVLGL